MAAGSQLACLLPGQGTVDRPISAVRDGRREEGGCRGAQEAAVQVSPISKHPMWAVLTGISCYLNGRRYGRPRWPYPQAAIEFGLK